MTIRVRTVLMLIVGLGLLALAGCDHYNCSSSGQFGSSTCTSGSSSLGGGSTTGSASAYVFAGDESGTIDSFTYSTSAGTLGATSGYTGPTTPSSFPVAGITVAQGLYLYAVYYEAGEIFGWTIGSNGSLTAISGSPFSAPYLAGSALPGGAQTAITNPSGTLLFIEDLDGTAIYTFQIGEGGALTAASGSPVVVPGLPENLATDGLGKYLYVSLIPTGGGVPEVGAYAIGSSGSLTVVPGSPFSYPMYQVEGEPSGKYLIGTQNNSSVSSLYVFSIQSTGAITPVAGSPFSTVYAPYSIATQSNSGGELVYSFSLTGTSGTYNAVEGYTLNTSTGALTAVPSSPFTSVANGYLGQFDQSGAFLTVYNNIISNEVLQVLAVGSDGALTQPITSGDLIVSGLVVITDPN
jgi:hypothetical protein